MSRNVRSAIFALDSYNRGYGVNIGGLSEAGKLGNATLLAATTEQQQGWQDSGFYAIAYDVSGLKDEDGIPLFGDNDTVISYRGTNFSINWNPFTFLNSPIIDDVRSGWSVGAGLPGMQAVQALDFYLAVAPDGLDPREANILITGHSLGGGLAGFASNVFNGDGILFDHMPYTPLSATLRAYFNARERFFGGEEIWDFSDDGISAYSTEKDYGDRCNIP